MVRPSSFSKVSTLSTTESIFNVSEDLRKGTSLGFKTFCLAGLGRKFYKTKSSLSSFDFDVVLGLGGLDV